MSLSFDRTFPSCWGVVPCLMVELTCSRISVVFASPLTFRNFLIFCRSLVVRIFISPCCVRTLFSRDVRPSYWMPILIQAIQIVSCHSCEQSRFGRFDRPILGFLLCPKGCLQNRFDSLATQKSRLYFAAALRGIFESVHAGSASPFLPIPPCQTGRPSSPLPTGRQALI